ncbi:MAG TPA: flagella accessory protein C, partial [Candidatus Thermoplasmatota archaeon]|nr:flagella accessory protein C [Candidatus Thermoplasmatota archaeon]
MKLFSRPKSDAAEASQASGSPSGAPAEAHAGAAGSPGATQTVVPVGAAAPPEAAEFAQALDNSVKEMSEKIQRLTSNLDNVHEERQAFEEKLSRMEERMRKLSSLTEMISNQYNPFIGDEPSDGGELDLPDGNKPKAATPPAAAENPFQLPPPLEASLPP